MTGVYVLLAAAMCGAVMADLSDPQIKQAVISTSVDMFKVVTSGQLSNKVVSPASAAILLAVLEQGAEDRSSQQLQSALRLSREQIQQVYGQLANELQTNRSSGTQLKSATHVFVSEDVSVQPDYNRTVASLFNSGVKKIPFDKLNASSAINSWAYNATEGKITSVVDSVSPPQASIFLANAAYFKSPWKNQFRSVDTEEDTFSVEPNRNVTIYLMHQARKYKMGSSEKLAAKWIQIPFKGDHYYLLVVLPDEEFGLAKVLEQMSSSDLASMLDEGQLKTVNVSLPLFRFSSSTNLTPAFSQLGVKDIFDSQNAKLSGITDTSPVKVYDSFQKAAIDIDENGGDSSISSGEENKWDEAEQEFRVDHPFLAVIASKEGVPVFMSTVVEPNYPDRSSDYNIPLELRCVEDDDFHICR